MLYNKSRNISSNQTNIRENDIVSGPVKKRSMSSIKMDNNSKYINTEYLNNLVNVDNTNTTNNTTNNVTNKKEITMGDIIQEVSNIKLKYEQDMNYIIEDIQNGRITKEEAMEELLKFYRERNINSEMMVQKLMFIIFCLCAEIFAVRYMKVEKLKGLSKYMCGKMPNFIEFMHFMASENVDNVENVEHDANFHYSKLMKAILIEFIVFIGVSLCSDGTILKSNMLDKIADITINDTKGNVQDNLAGYLAGMVASFATSNNDTNEQTEL